MSVRISDQFGEPFGGRYRAVHLPRPGGDLETGAERRFMISAEGGGRFGENVSGDGERLVRIAGTADLAGEE